MHGDHQNEQFDRDRWRQSVTGRTLYVTARDDEQPGGERTTGGRNEPAECGLCDETVLPVADRETARCPLCGFAV